jgi:hypothetical protein
VTLLNEIKILKIIKNNMGKLINQISIVIIAVIAYTVYNHYNLKIKPLFNIPPIQTDIEPGRCKLIPGNLTSATVQLLLIIS